MHTGFQQGKPEAKRPLGRRRDKWEFNNKWTLKENFLGSRVRNETGSGQEQVADCCEHGNEHLGFKKCGEFLDQLMNEQLCKKTLLRGLINS